MNLNDLDRSKYVLIEADNPKFQYMGRIDFSNKKAPTVIYAGSTIRARFEGTSLKMAIRNKNNYYNNYIGYIIDNNFQGKIKVPKNNKEIVLDVASGLKDTVHDVIIFKRQDGCHYFDFLGIILDKGKNILRSEERSKRRIECFGDSVSAGELVEALKYVGKKDPEKHNGEYSNAWYSYSMMTARYLKAEIHNNAQGGLALSDGTGYFRGPNYLGLESVYKKLKYNPEIEKCNEWDFSSYIPHVVIIALGQNDNYPDDYINTNMEKKRLWIEKYKEIVRDLRSKYPKALFVLITTILEHDISWDYAIDDVQKELRDPKVVRYKFERNGIATPGHPRISESEEMAIELSRFISSFGRDIWE
ncbi:MAG: electron transporter RnfD [Clostridium sp.]|nr:electron transporter RnfD [Clostridium sp.]